MISFFKHGSIQGTFLLANRVRQKMNKHPILFFVLFVFPRNQRLCLIKCNTIPASINREMSPYKGSHQNYTGPHNTGIRGDLMKLSNVLIHFNYSITKKSLAALSLQNASSRSSHEIETVRVYLFNGM